jgi:hypothetical protein
VFERLGFVDVYRKLYPDHTGEAYTWWSNRGQAWAKNVGWRIDYQIATPGIDRARPGGKGLAGHVLVGSSTRTAPTPSDSSPCHRPARAAELVDYDSSRRRNCWSPSSG